jgi:hypothetical protein
MILKIYTRDTQLQGKNRKHGIKQPAMDLQECNGIKVQCCLPDLPDTT